MIRLLLHAFGMCLWVGESTGEWHGENSLTQQCRICGLRRRTKRRVYYYSTHPGGLWTTNKRHARSFLNGEEHDE